MAPKLEFDPSRLLALDRKRTSVRAAIRGLSDEYHNLREKRQDVQRRAALARSKAEGGDPRSRAGYVEQIDAADAEAAELTRQMADVQRRIDDLAEEAGAASAVATSALKFAIEHNLSVPSELRARAGELRGDVHPFGITSVRDF
jgi:hypothetical protein